MTIDFYFSPGSGPCRTIELTAKSLGIQLNYKQLDLMVKKEQLTPEFIKINPQHCVPTIVDDGFSLCEGNVIATYLIQKYAKDDSLYPKDPKQRAIVDHKLYFNNGVLNQRFADYFYPIMLSGQSPDPEKYKKIEEALEFLDIFLQGKDFVAGDCVTVADFALSTTIATYDVMKIDRSAYKNIAKWYKKLESSVVGFDEINNVEKLTQIFEGFRNFMKQQK